MTPEQEAKLEELRGAEKAATRRVQGLQARRDDVHWRRERLTKMLSKLDDDLRRNRKVLEETRTRLRGAEWVTMIDARDAVDES
jgi:predicted  nucleic acid-binding Zn-ribbon protein